MKKFLTLLLAPALISSAFAQGQDYQKKYEALVADKSLSDGDKLHKLFDLDWDRGLHESPEFATSVGYPGLDGLWTDMSQKAIDGRKSELEWPLLVIKAIDRSKLSKADQLNYDIFRRDVEIGIEGTQFPGELLAISQLGGVQQSVAQTIDQMPKKSVESYENMLSRLRGAPALIDQNIELLKRGLAQGVTQPKITLRAVPTQILDVIPEDPLQSAMLKPFTEFPENIPAADQERLRAEAVKIYKEQLVPAYDKLYDFVTKEYLPGSRAKGIGLEGLPNGKAWYAYNVRTSTTTNMTPEEINALGLSEVKRIRTEMDKVIADVKFQGSFDDFTKFLRTDPQFYYTKPEDLLAGYRDIAKRIDPELPRLFATLPQLTYGVRAVPAYAEKSAPTAYYQGGSMKAGRPGWFFANTFNLPSRPKWQMECLTLHEAVPGHHLQISIAQELDLPEFRKYEGYTAYVEGWALYCETLGDELGFYKDPYSRFGQLTFEMWRADRLVVDTGMHSLGWTRQQAIDFMKGNTGQDEFSATVEVDRYIVWPAQALAYKIGQLKIRELRTYAEHELGDKFDVRTFHDAILRNGALPLDVLESMMKEWVAEQKAQVMGR